MFRFYLWGKKMESVAEVVLMYGGVCGIDFAFY